MVIQQKVIDTVSIDSRSLQNSEHTLFFALVGPNNDAHAYIEDLIATGCKTLWCIPDKCADKANFHCRKHFSRFTAICRLLS
jgi:alanine racemase